MTRSLAKTIMMLLSTTPLVACGGGTGTNSVSTGLPAATAGPPPAGFGGGTSTAPPPTGFGGNTSTGTPATPAASYKTYDQLTGDQSFQASSEGIDTRKPFTDRGAIYSPDIIDYSAATNTYTLTYTSVGKETFLNGNDPVAGTTFNIKEFGAPGTFNYTRYAEYSRNRISNTDIGLAVIGVPTLGTDQPAGVARFRSSAFVGTAARQEGDTSVLYGLGNSSFDMTVDFTANTLDARLTLVGTPVAGGTDVALGSWVHVNTGRNFAVESTLGFGGVLQRDAGSALVGGMRGKFYGPQAAEFGMAFDVTEKTGSTTTFVAVGVVAGRKQ